MAGSRLPARICWPNPPTQGVPNRAAGPGTPFAGTKDDESGTGATSRQKRLPHETRKRPERYLRPWRVRQASRPARV